VIRIKVLWVVIAIVIGLLLVLSVGLLVRPEDGKQPTGLPAGPGVTAAATRG
jgi:hypothetical protein